MTNTTVTLRPVIDSSREQLSGNFLVYLNETYNLPTIILFISLILVTLIFVTYHQKFSLLFTSLFSQRHLSQLQREGKLANRNLFIWVHSIIFLIQALFIYIILDYFFPKIFNLINPNILYFITLGIVIVDFILKRVFSLIYFKTFDYNDELTSYKMYKMLFNFTNTILLMIIIPLSLYTTEWKLIWIFLPILIITFSFTSFKIFTINPKRIKLFQFFIYFCTLEILPYLVILKLLILTNK